MEDFEGMLLIHGYLFKLNERRDKLMRYDNKSITDLDQLDLVMGYYQGRFQKEYRTLIGESDDLTDYDKFWWPEVKIPRKVIESTGLSESEIRMFNRESDNQHLGYSIVDKELSKMLNGQLPEIKLDGLIYSVDTIKGEIRQAANSEIKFHFTEDDNHSPSSHFYNTVLKCPAMLHVHMNEIPKNVVVLEFPALYAMDPFARARKNGIELTRARMDSIWATAKDIKVKGLQETKIPELVRRNQIEQEFRIPAKSNQKLVRANHQRKKGIS